MITTKLPIAALLLLPLSAAADESLVDFLRVPEGGIQPQVAVDGSGDVHLLSYRGSASAGDLYWSRSTDGGKSIADGVRVNSQEGSAVAAGTIRGGHIALGRDGRVHVAWNGSGRALPKGPPNPELPEDSPYRAGAPMLYTRLAADGRTFEPQRNLMTKTYALDGGGSLAADARGNVWVVWHANAVGGPKGEGGRAVWVARSTDDGKTFGAERRANPDDTGACGCCGLRATAGADGSVYVLYRTATRVLERDMHLLVSTDGGKRFRAAKIDEWRVPKCVMSSSSFHATGDRVLLAWETMDDVKFGTLTKSRAFDTSRVTTAPGKARGQKHPVLASDENGRTILAWTEGTGWKRGGAVAWQVWDRDGKLLSAASGRRDGIPVWSFAAVFARPGGGFTVVY